MIHKGSGEKSAAGDVALRLPADSAYVSVLRGTAASLAARLDFTLDDIEDLRMAVGEASALVLEQASQGADLNCEFHLGPSELTVHISAKAESAVAPDEDSFAWQVLTTLATSASILAEDHRLQITVSLQSSLREPDS